MISFFVQFVRQHFLIICCCVVTAVVWPNLRTHLISDKQPLPAATQSDPAIRVLTADELAKFDGIHNEKLYLSILGMVFDVTKGAKHYQPGASYNYFVGEYFGLLPNKSNTIFSQLNSDGIIFRRQRCICCIHYRQF